MLCNDELARYSRHLNLSQIGIVGQEKLKTSKVLCIGAGGLGSPILLYLAAAGVGHIGIIDYDIVETSNLQRQILYSESNKGQAKAQVAKNNLTEFNSNIDITAYEKKLTEKNALSILKAYDLIIDGSDNFVTRYLVNDACVNLKIPFVSASIYQFSGQLSVFNYKGGPCYRCLYSSPPPPELSPNCSETGVLGVVPGVLGTMAANEGLKILLNMGTIASGILITYDALSAKIEHNLFCKNNNCPACLGTDFKDLPRFVNKPNISIKNTIAFKELQTLLNNKEKHVELIDIRDDWERKIISIPNSKHMPVSKISTLSPNPAHKLTVLYCKTGIRSQKAVQHYLNEGVNNIFSLQGGVISWAKEALNQDINY